jgi:hypothetical protein
MTPTPNQPEPGAEAVLLAQAEAIAADPSVSTAVMRHFALSIAPALARAREAGAEAMRAACVRAVDIGAPDDWPDGVLMSATEQQAWESATEACASEIRIATLPTPPPAAQDPEREPTYPCADCGTPRTKAEGGTTFTVCDECWDRRHPAAQAPKLGKPIWQDIECPNGEIVRILAGREPAAQPQPPAGDEREAFEAWEVASWAPAIRHLALERYPNGDYRNNSVRDRWEGWQARAGRPA